MQAVSRVGAARCRPLVGRRGTFFDEEQVSAAFVGRDGPAVFAHRTLVGSTDIQIAVTVRGHSGERDGLIGNAVAGNTQNSTRARDLYDKGILGADEAVTAGSKQDIVLCYTGDVNVPSIVHDHITDLLCADTTAADDPLEGPVGPVEFGDEDFSIGHVDARAAKVGLA